MKLLLSQHPYWVLLALGVTLVYAEEDEDILASNNNSNNNNNNNNNDNDNDNSTSSNNSVPSALRRPPYHENLLRKLSTTTLVPPDVLASTAIRSSSSTFNGVLDSKEVTREGRIMVGKKPNRTSDTTDFARNTVPVKDQTPTDPTVKKTEQPWKPMRKPIPDLKNKLRGERIRYGSPPGPDASMLAYNAFTTQLTEPTTERHIRKPFTTKSRPPPLSYLTSTADSPLPPTAWALTTLKGSAPASEHVKNTIPATASEPLKSSKPRTTLSSVKPINSFWSTRLLKYPSTVSTYAVTETTEPTPDQHKSEEAIKEPSSTSTTEEVSMKDDNQMNNINEGKLSSPTSELSSPDNNTNTNSITVTQIGEQESQTIRNNDTQLKSSNIEVTTTLKELNQTNTINEIELLPKENVLKNNTVKTEAIDEINEAIKRTDEENQLSKIVDEKYIIKSETFVKNNLMDKAGVNKVEVISDNNHTTTENYGNTLTEKPDLEIVKKIKEKVNQSAEEVSEKPAVPEPVVTELNKIISDNVHDIEQENNYNTAVYPFGNIINETKFTHKLLTDEIKPMDLSVLMNVTSEGKLNNEPAGMNAIVSMSSINDTPMNNQSMIVINETDQSTTSMTRATNATQPPVNSTTEANLVTIVTTTNITNEQNITEAMAITMMAITTTPGTTIQDDLLTTLTVDSHPQYQTIRNDISEIGLHLSTTVQNVTTVSPSPLTTQTFNISSQENGTSLLNATMDNDVNTTNVNITSKNIENNLNISKNFDNTLNKIINLNTTLKENDIKSIPILEPSINHTKLLVQSSTESNTLPPIITTVMSNHVGNKSFHTLRKHFELNQTNNDIKLGGELDLPVPTIISVMTSSPLTTRSNYIKTTTEKPITTTKFYQKTDEVPEMLSELPVTDLNIIKDRETTITVQPIQSKNNVTNYPYDYNNNDTETTTTTPLLFHETDELNEDDSLIYNTTGNDKTFPIETAINMTEHDIDDNGDEVVSGEKDMVELIPSSSGGDNTTSLIEETTTTMVTISVDTMKNITTTEVPITTTTTTTTTSTSTIRTTVFVTTPTMEEEGVTPVEEDSTGIDVEDYETGITTPMNVRLRVLATYKEICSEKDLMIESIVRLFKTVERDVDRKQIKLLNLERECIPPYRTDKAGVPVHLRITDNQGQYDKRLTEIFETLVAQDSLWFKYQVTQMDEVQEPSMDTEAQGSGTIIAAIVISSIAGLCLLILTILLVIMRKRQRGFNYGQRCTPVSLDDYSLDNISVYNSVRRKAMRASKRSYGNPAFDDPTAISNSLNFAGLANAVNDKAKLEDEFSKIPIVTVKSDELPPGAEVKNRYANVIPLPETRVMLNTPNNNDIDQFINANFVKGAKGCEKFYIACQAPMKDTVTDFWQMVWEQQSRIIIMLTDHHENGVEKCADYLPPSEVLDCHRVFGDLQVTLKKREAREKYIISSLQLKNLESNLWREVTHMWYIGWPGRGVPDDLSSVIAFLIEARSYAKNGPPIVVHCSPGTGRTGTIIAIDISIRDFETDRVVDIPRTVYNIRRDRAGAVQTSQQYTFIYQVLHLYATKLTGGGLDSI